MPTDLFVSSKVSVIVPCYNTAKYLNKCMRSILRQTYKHFEVLLINDGSTDKTAELCDYWALKDSRVRVFHKKNGGVSSARNIGIQNVTGEYVMFVDPDDYIDANMIKKMLSAAIQHCVDIVSCGYIRKILFFKSKRLAPFECDVVYNHHFIIDTILKSLITSNIDVTLALNNPTKLIRTSIIKNNNFQYDESWDHAEDTKFMAEVLQKTNSIIFLNYTPYYYIRHLNKNSLTHRFFPHHFAQRVRYRLFTDELALHLFNISSQDRDTANAIIHYAHEEAVNIFKHTKKDSDRNQYLQEIFSHQLYKTAVELVPLDHLPESLHNEILSVKKNSFSDWRKAIALVK